MSDWYYYKLNEIERRLEAVSANLSPRQQARLEAELADIRKEIGWGKGAFLLGAPDDLMYAGTRNSDDRLRRLEKVIDGTHVSWACRTSSLTPTRSVQRFTLYAWIFCLLSPLLGCLLGLILFKR